jgi:isocitrate dehydrogenase kinase/phosphatase
LILRAKSHFENRDWHAVQRDSAHRLDLYNAAVQEGLAGLRDLLGPALEARATWTGLRDAYAPLAAGRGDAELAETFFNSFTRRVFHTIGVDPATEFVHAASSGPVYGPPWSLTLRIPCDGSLERLFAEALSCFSFAPGFADAAGDAARIAEAVEAQQPAIRVESLELARSAFFRGKGAYLVGLMHSVSGDVPLLIALTNPPGGVTVDAVLTTADEVSIVFSFARSYFLVSMDRPREMVDFLRTIMPRKAIAELYNALGFDKHGKTELYRGLLQHLQTSRDRFETAPGQRGMVMAVFALPGFDVVFKVLRDHFDAPKTVTHDEVREKYRMVFRHDRAGRLVDAQEFEHLAFERSRFEPALLEELTLSCSERVQVHGERVIISHLYTERRLRPLDVFLKEADPEAARDAVADYGQVLRDLAATNIFPGDMLLKNFGVSRHGRLIFYDYDELCTLTDCRFRELPTAEDGEEGAAEAWFYVGERDIFPEEFRAFLGLPGPLLEVFLARHGELLNVGFWHHMQERHRNGEVLDIYPYRSSRRLRPTPRRSRDAADRKPSGA